MTMPEWRRRKLEAAKQAAPLGDWWKRRHHCSDVVLGQRHLSQNVDMQGHTVIQSQAVDPLRQERLR